MPNPIPISVALQSLQGISRLAAQAWRNLQEAESPEAETGELEWLWQMQDTQEDLIDAHAELADQIDAEISAIQARLDYLMQLHQAELNRLKRWRRGLDDLVLKLNQEGILGTEAAGHVRRIRIKLNPPSCEVVALNQVPIEYVKVEIVENKKVDKTAIKAAWAKGEPVPGTQVSRKRKVVYELTPTSLERMKAK